MTMDGFKPREPPSSVLFSGPVHVDGTAHLRGAVYSWRAPTTTLAQSGSLARPTRLVRPTPWHGQSLGTGHVSSPPPGLTYPHLEYNGTYLHACAVRFERLYFVTHSPGTVDFPWRGPSTWRAQWIRKCNPMHEQVLSLCKNMAGRKPTTLTL